MAVMALSRVDSAEADGVVGKAEAVDSYTRCVQEAASLVQEKGRIENRLAELRERIAKGTRRERIVLPSGFQWSRYTKRGLKVPAKDKDGLWNSLSPKARKCCFSPTLGTLERLASSGVITQELFDTMFENWGSTTTVSKFSTGKPPGKPPVSAPTLRKV